MNFRSHIVVALTGAMSGLASAQISGFSAGPGSDSLVLPPFQYVASNPVEADAKPAPARAPALQNIVDLHAAGNYEAAGSQGLILMTQQPVDGELQLIIANSLAWSGRTQDAVPTYQAISKGPQANAAKIGLANINRWRGRDDLALPLYQSVLTQEPENPEAISGLAMASRTLAPKTTFKGRAAADSSDLRRRLGAVSHEWRSRDFSEIFEVEAAGFKDWSPTAQAVQRELTGRYQNLALPLKPSLELTLTTQLKPSIYGIGRIKLLDDAITLGAGRVNWGKLSSNPDASFVGLNANYLGAVANQSFSMGSVIAKADYYGVSDGNTVLTSSVTFNPAWRPLGNHFKPFVGMETRSATFNSSKYWSPTNGYGAAFAGLLGEWGEESWNLFGSVQVGTALFGEAGRSWSVSAGGKYWLTNDIAVGANLWSMSSWRDSSTYRAKAVDAYLEKIWP